jgi:hypothetical protein
MFNLFRRRRDEAAPLAVQAPAPAPDVPQGPSENEKDGQGPAATPSGIAASTTKMRDDIRSGLEADIGASTKAIKARVAAPTGERAPGAAPRASTNCPGCGGSGRSPFGNPCGTCLGRGLIGSE